MGPVASAAGGSCGEGAAATEKDKEQTNTGECTGRASLHSNWPERQDESNFMSSWSSRDQQAPLGEPRSIGAALGEKGANGNLKSTWGSQRGVYLSP